MPRISTMRLSGAVEQACCIVILLAHPDLRSPVTNQSLAKQMGVSPTYITKVTRKLVTAQLITSARGAGGGFRLARASTELTLWDIVAAVEGTESFVQYQGVAERMFARQADNSKIKRGEVSILGAFDRAQARWAETLQTVTLQDIIRELMNNG